MFFEKNLRSLTKLHKPFRKSRLLCEYYASLETKSFQLMYTKVRNVQNGVT